MTPTADNPASSFELAGVDRDWLVAFRRELHSSPELGYNEFATAERIAVQLRTLGFSVAVGVGLTGVVGSLKVGDSSRSIGLRADMDALPIHEETGLSYSSTNPGVFHGCGHDGHATMLLGAAQHLAATREFDGTVHCIFQPAEEGLAGARAMIDDGLFKRFPCDRIFAVHNWPELPLGTIATRAGPIMAAADKFEIELTGQGGHAALPHKTPDIILATAELVSQLNHIVSRRIPAIATAVLSVTQISSGHTHNVLPAAASIMGTVRTFDTAIQDSIERAIRSLLAAIELSHGVKTRLAYRRYYPATVNNSDAVAQLVGLSRTVGEVMISDHPSFCSEDFGFMLAEKPGAYIWLGQCAGGKELPLHHPKYDFNDEVLMQGARLYAALATDYLSITPSKSDPN